MQQFLLVDNVLKNNSSNNNNIFISINNQTIFLIKSFRLRFSNNYVDGIQFVKLVRQGFVNHFNCFNNRIHGSIGIDSEIKQSHEPFTSGFLKSTTLELILSQIVRFFAEIQLRSIAKRQKLSVFEGFDKTF